MFKTWTENTFQSFKKDPISFDVFDKIHNSFEKFLEFNTFDKILDKDDESTGGTYCGISFKKDQLLYHCK